MEGRVSDRNVQHVRGGHGVSRLERTAKDPVGDGWAFLIFDIDCARFSDGLSQVIRKHLDPGPNDTFLRLTSPEMGPTVKFKARGGHQRRRES